MFLLNQARPERDRGRATATPTTTSWAPSNPDTSHAGPLAAPGAAGARERAPTTTEQRTDVHDFRRLVDQPQPATAPAGPPERGSRPASIYLPWQAFRERNQDTWSPIFCCTLRALPYAPITQGTRPGRLVGPSWYPYWLGPLTTFKGGPWYFVGSKPIRTLCYARQGIDAHFLFAPSFLPAHDCC